MKRIASVAVGLAIWLLMLVPSDAATETIVQGTVMGTGAGNLSVVSASGEYMEFVVPAGTHITRDGKSCPLNELRAHDRVTVKSSRAGEPQVASAISARSPF